MRGNRLAAIGAIGSLALVATACGEAPDEEQDVAKDYLSCMVTDVGGIDDRSFNASAWKGMNDAMDEQSAIDVKYKKSESNKDYEPNLKAFIQEDCDMIIAVGGLMADATAKVAEDNPDQRFAIIDSHVELDNVYSLEFNAAESSFLAGYLAAASSESEKVATYGGDKIDPVTIFMDGFDQGVAHYNDENDAEVELLGWSEESQEGSFTNDFQDTEEGKNLAENFISQGADVIFPVAGQSGLGGLSVTEKDDEVHAIWVDIDGCVSAEKYCDEFLSTSAKDIPGAVHKLLIEDREGNAEEGGHYVGTLEDEGVSLDRDGGAQDMFRDDVPEELQEEIMEISEQITAGDIEITSPAQPTTD